MHNFDTDPVAQSLRDIVIADMRDAKAAIAPNIPTKVIGFVALLAIAASTCLLAFCSAQTENDLLTQELNTCQTGEKLPFVTGGLGGFSPKQEHAK